MKTGVDQFATSAIVRIAVVVGWTSISLLAYFSRFERMGAGLAVLMGTVIVAVGSMGLTWAVWPEVRDTYRRRVR